MATVTSNNTDHSNNHRDDNSDSNNHKKLTGTQGTARDCGDSGATNCAVAALSPRCRRAVAALSPR
eukprot:9498148-Alexandrium_andersonii.AAC.1